MIKPGPGACQFGQNFIPSAQVYQAKNAQHCTSTAFTQSLSHINQLKLSITYVKLSSNCGVCYGSLTLFGLLLSSSISLILRISGKLSSRDPIVSDIFNIR